MRSIKHLELSHYSHQSISRPIFLILLFQLGRTNQLSPSLLLTYDTCAAYNVGYLGHNIPIAERFPQLVKSLLYEAKKETLLTLSGITSDKEGSKMTMEPTVISAVIKYWLPFLTKEGHRTTLTIALGKFVSVNMSIRVPNDHQASKSILRSCQ